MVHSGARSAVDVGAVIADTYTIEGLLGRGGMGAVWLASHARLPGKKVAIKVLHPDVADAESLARFRREAEIASRLGHANIVGVHDFNVLPDGTPYLVLEYLEGESLAQRLARGPLPLDQTMTIVRQVGSALAAAHREEIVHRDLKPQNVFLVHVETDDGSAGFRAKVLDFGISKMRGSTTIKTQEASILGTPQYMAPEQALGNHAAVDARTDVFALGAMVYEMLSGGPAFSGASVPEVVFKVVYEQPVPIAQRVRGLPPHVVAAIERALAKKSEERFPDVPSFVETLTGQPLTTGKRPPVAIAPGDAQPRSDRISSKEALAHTIDSGNHAAAGVSVATDATIASGQHAPPPAAAAKPAEPAPEATTLPTLSKPSRGHAGTVVVVGIVAAAAVAIAFVMSRDKTPATTAAAPAAAADAAAAPAAAAAAAPAAAAAAAAEPDAAADTGAATAPAAAPKKPRKTDGPPSAAPAPDDAADDQELADCRGLLRAGEPEDALRCANLVLEKKPRAVAAYVIRASAYCDLEDQEKAIASLRKLAGRARLRRTAIAYCAKRGITLE